MSELKCRIWHESGKESAKSWLIPAECWLNVAKSASRAWRFPVSFPQETMCFRDPAVVFYSYRSVLLPPSWITMTVVFLVWQGPQGTERKRKHFRKLRFGTLRHFSLFPRGFGQKQPFVHNSVCSIPVLHKYKYPTDPFHTNSGNFCFCHEKPSKIPWIFRSCQTHRSGTYMARFARIISGFSSTGKQNPESLQIAFRGTKNCESQVWGDSSESLERYENRVLLRVNSRESPRFALRISGKSKWGLSNEGLRPLSAICAQSSTIVRFCGPFGRLSKGNFRRKMTTIVGNRGQLWTSTLSPHVLSPHLDFPENRRAI